MVGASSERCSEEVLSSSLRSAKGSSIAGQQHNRPVEEGNDWAAGLPQRRLSVFPHRSGSLCPNHISFFEQRPISAQQWRSPEAGKTCFVDLSLGLGVSL